jgi:hypothetical protein
MPLNISDSTSTEAISVPYPAFSSPTRTNHGFVDLRGRPELAGKIAEAIPSRKFRALLVRLAGSDASLFSIGCDLGHHSDLEAEKGRRRVAGGYLHVSSSRYNEVHANHWATLCNSVSDRLRQAVRSNLWEVNFDLNPIMMNLDSYHRLTGSVSISFFAHAKSHQDAVSSRERLIAALDDSLSDDAVQAAFNPK